MSSGFELYLTPRQKNGGSVTGFDLEKHLQRSMRFDRCFSLDDEVVKGWLANPATYPEEFKKRMVFLWKSKWTSGDITDVAYLYWDDGRVIVRWRWLEYGWGGRSPVLLASS
ncbi:MAG: hypothetical protein A2843_00935 [Candidatus Wildermuthbacteria bacterium RIFCSPHIGHO2_01_FULL_48_27b]|uniref:Uncharacterized protein n=2 Tax=Parcubacteria group TaxID=1794811 RepID=A0A1G2QUY9_9BACT|nr:MAG: hypothetical protein A2933_02305 [Candidatus Nomurabacteria bacterium RIFCSPLOWO2_01_FULL_46_18]OHA63671.1 MAG: hypothetical protein A2843_00935 [Candidatus Wildermuthbacteria bacterium RIFCSPHIGHO2_01_FULL_48_27b]